LIDKKVLAMTPQSPFMVVAPIDPHRKDDLKKLLASMNHGPGVVNPQNALVPFGQFGRLHFARFVMLDDQSLNDITAYGLPRRDFPVYLAFLGDCDGSADDVLADLVKNAGDGLRMIFSHCQGFPPDCNLLRWMKQYGQKPATMYINWLGRTVRQIREENALRQALETHLDEYAAALAGQEPSQIRNKLREFVKFEQRAGRLSLTAPEPTPLLWRLQNLVHCVGVPLIIILLTPLLLLYLPVFVFQLRRRERSDPVIAPRPEASHAAKLAELEDHDVTNQFSAFGSLKPGLFRRWTLICILWAANYTTRHIFIRGHLARVKTIHFARWVFLDDKQRLYFASNYDGSLESYMDDFINKVGWGLNLVFSNGMSYPRTDWLILGGAKDEQKFKYVLRRHQLPTEVWYNAHPGLTAFDLERNTLIRQGLEQPAMTEVEIREWLKLL
jgi:hypothetical protein